jgi:hypothetical protein
LLSSCAGRRRASLLKNLPRRPANAKMR